MTTNWLPLSERHLLPVVAGVYILRNKLNNKEYVGKSENVRKRVRVHATTQLRDTVLYRAMRDSGMENFECCLYLTGSKEEIVELEVLLIAERNTLVPNGYNLTIGGDGTSGWVPSAEFRKKQSELHLGVPKSAETKAKMSEANRIRFSNPAARVKQSVAMQSRTITAEHRANIAAAALGRISAKRKTVALKLQLFYREFPSTSALAKYLGVAQPTISNWATGKVPFPLDRWSVIGGEVVKIDDTNARGLQTFKAASGSVIYYVEKPT